jgi:class 3 adenylate cyclase
LCLVLLTLDVNRIVYMDYILKNQLKARREVEVSNGDAIGMAVHTAARVMSAAGAGEVFASWTTRDLLTGFGVALESAGRHDLEGLEGERELFRVKAG